MSLLDIPLSPAAGAALAETEMWAVLADRMFRYGAASVAIVDLDAVPLEYVGTNVVADVVINATGGAEVARLPLGALGPLLHGGVDIADVRAPARCLGWAACAISAISATGDTFFVVADDRRGIGGLVTSGRAMSDGRTLGEFVTGRWSRSGVAQTRHRAAQAARTLTEQHSGDGDIVRALTAASLFEHFAELPAGAASHMSVVHLAEHGGGHWWIPQPPSVPRAADVVTDALATEAWGRTKPDALASRSRVLRFEDEPERDEAGRKVDRSVASYDDLDAARGFESPGLISQFSWSQVSADPTGNTVATWAGGRADDEDGGPTPDYWPGPRDDVATHTATRCRELRDHGGLTAAQAGVVALAELGLSLREIARALDRDPSTISRTMSRARERLAKEI